jgi:hypothetical protein
MPEWKRKATKGLGGKEPNMLIIGCDYHPGFQQIAFVDTESGEWENGAWLPSKKRRSFIASPRSEVRACGSRRQIVRLGSCC